MLADYGADVIKVEKPDGGDMARRVGPFPGDVPHPEKSGLFLHLNMNKRGVTINLKSAAGRKLFLQLVEWADVVVENFAPRVMPSLGLSYDDLAKVNPRVVMVSISNFGQTGPYRDYKADDMVLYGMGGTMRTRGVPDRPPVKYGTEVALRQAGLIAAGGVMTGLFARERRGEGEHVDVSIFETAAGSQDQRTLSLVRYQFTGELDSRKEAGSASGGGVYPCKNGYINISLRGKRFELALVMMDRVDLLDDPRFATLTERNRPENALFFENEVLLPWMMQRNVEDVWQFAQENHILAGVIYTSKNLVADSHFRDRGMWVEVDHPVAGRYEYPGRPSIWEKTPWRLRYPAPLLGQHNEEVFTSLGYTQEDLFHLRGQGAI
jgi:crotonobetainyl-CoA:carnitine CoA-transferase CaiB-like acyl-CoA transferase